MNPFYDGVLLHIGVEKGGTAPVNEVLAVIGEKGEDVDALLKDAGSSAEVVEAAVEEKEEETVKESSREKPDPTPVTIESAPVEIAATATSNGSSGNERIFASPLAKKMAAEKGINLAAVVGTGENQRIIKRDIENYQPAASANGGAATVTYQTVGTESHTDVPNSQMRKAIAKALSASKFSAPHFYLKMEVDMDNAIAARKAINEEEGIKVSFNDMIVKAVAAALRRHPKVNADWMGRFYPLQRSYSCWCRSSG